MDVFQDELEVLKKGLNELKIRYSQEIIDKFSLYIEILQYYKHKVHLISHNDYFRISIKHFLPSLLVLQFLKDEHYACDIGAGAGFPSIPVKIIKPEINFTLFESVKKKAKILEFLIKELKLKGIKVKNMRAEQEKENYDLILVRAAGRIKKLIKLVYSLLKPEGRVIFYKSPNISDELDEAKSEIERYKLSVEIKNLFTPVVHEPISLIFLEKNR